ncbi:hypothetical protein GGTG_08212 [Gaeumannomyces tritici R3-111a-1]|uniref:Uncharacterized protein n=1 Tax=Gaeumannomyces tritici (strain R3-111a-1) TaxID=644352 RepID=J3P3X7_GAET3|nr:hypothetical protein GGTG_08212 [Gaeumannomyces tritici R3-111a-1]EJT74371.1 hypothetical protein GGTG_08212 [Gaeumannomyces tritici R3-111a-1]
MANAKPVPPLDTLEVLVNDVLVQAGKAFKSSRRDARRVPSLASVNKIRDIHVDFNSALDDVESELIRAKAVLQRDLDQLRAKRRPVVIPEPVMIPLAPTGLTPVLGAPAPPPGSLPMAGSGPGPGPRNVPKQPALHPPPASRPVPRPKQGAPFPNMGIDPPPPGPSPQPGVPKVKAEPHTSQLTGPAKPTATAQAVKPGAKGGSPAVKNASSSLALKSVPPAGKVTSPAKKAIPSPVVKPGSPAMKATPSLPSSGKTNSPVPAPVRPVPKATPPTVPKPSLTPASAPKSAAVVPTATAPAPTPAPTPPVPHAPAAPMAVAIPAQAPTPALASGIPNPAQLAQAIGQPDQLTGMLEMSNAASGGGGGVLHPGATAAPHLNFTDMQFSLAPGNMDPQSQPQSHPQGAAGTDGVDTEFDLETYVADATNNILSDSFSGSGGNQPSAAIADNASRPIDLSNGDSASASFKSSGAEALNSNMDDLFKMDADMDLGAAGDTNFDDLWIEGDTAMEDFFDLS